MKEPNAEDGGVQPVRESNAEDGSVQTVSESNVETGDDGQNVSEPQMLERYTELYEINQDLAGWLSIEGMKIDYPVMQCEDDSYYLHHDFYGQDSKYGCLYVKERADFDAGTNFMIYGHNMKDGSMFGDLDLYLKEEFYKEHPAISFLLRQYQGAVSLRYRRRGGVWGYLFDLIHLRLPCAGRASGGGGKAERGFRHRKNILIVEGAHYVAV